MKTYLRNVLFASVLVAGSSSVATPAQAGGSFGMHVGNGGFGVTVGIGDWGPYTNSWTNPQWSLDYNVALSGYGEWVWAGDLGRVWRPWVAVGWRPYTYGRWVSTTFGWTWVAYEPWGYVPHHYGSWAMCNFGWVWVPGYTYSCGNVVWVRSGGYVGWYARPPWGWSHAARGYHHGYRDGYRDGWHDARYATYVDWHHMASDNVSHYRGHPHRRIPRSRRGPRGCADRGRGPAPRRHLGARNPRVAEDGHHERPAGDRCPARGRCEKHRRPRIRHRCAGPITRGPRASPTSCSLEPSDTSHCAGGAERCARSAG